MNNPPALLRSPLPSPPAIHYSLSESSSTLIPIFSVLSFVGLGLLICAFFFAITCPPNPFYRRSAATAGGFPTVCSKNVEQMVSSVEYETAAQGGESAGGGECPVCLTAFVDGEVIRKVNTCGHLFHGTCIDMWLASHSNCPVCRAFIGAAKRPKPAGEDGGEGDFRQGLPDSASLV